MGYALRRRGELDDREAIARRISEPGHGVPLAVIDPALVLRDSVEVLHDDASIRQFVNRPLEVLDGQIENGETSRLVLGLGIDENCRSISGLYPERTRAAGGGLGHSKPQRPTVKLPRDLDVVDGKAAERSCDVIHGCQPPRPSVRILRQYAVIMTT